MDHIWRTALQTQRGATTCNHTHFSFLVYDSTPIALLPKSRSLPVMYHTNRKSSPSLEVHCNRSIPRKSCNVQDCWVTYPTITHTDC